MLLDWFELDDTRSAAHRIRDAVTAALADPTRRTPDLGGRSTTRDVTRAILEHL